MKTSWQTHILVGNESPSFGNFSLVMAHRLIVLYPLMIVISFPLCRIWALAIIFWWLLSGRWKERLRQFQTNPFLVPLLLYLVFAAFGIAYTSATFYDAVREWHGRQTLLVVPVLATLLYRRPDRRDQMLAVYNLSILVAMTIYLTHFFCSDYLWSEYLRQRTIYLFKNSIGTGMILVLWAGLWVCYPFSSRRIPWIRSLLPRSTIKAMSIASRLDPCAVCAEMFKCHVSWQVLFFSLIRWGIVLGTMFYLFCVSPSRTAQLAFGCCMACLFLLWNFRKGLCCIIVLGAIIVPLAHSTSPFFAKKFERGFQDFNMFADAFKVGESSELVTNKDYRRVADGRLLLYQDLLEKAWEKPFIGHGMGMTEPICLSVGTENVRNPHNEYLGVAIQSGFIGLFLYCFLLATVFLVSFKQSAPWKELGIFIAVALIVDGLFNCALSYSSASRFYGILLAVVFSQYRSRKAIRRVTSWSSSHQNRPNRRGAGCLQTPFGF